MSGLEKFQSSEAWRTNFKKFLFMERKAEIMQNSLTMTESQRYSLDIDQDLKNIIEQKKKHNIEKNLDEEINLETCTSESYQQLEKNVLKEEINHEKHCDTLLMLHKTSDKSFETLKMSEKNVKKPNSSMFNGLNNEAEQQINNNLMWEKTSDESFEALERMCDKTASDPNSTLFQYLHSDRKEQLLAEVKKRSGDGKILNARDSEDNLLTKINDCTLLDDVEAPSRMWNNTICGDTILQTSPLKMVGLLRPSTIIEEAPNDSAISDVSSQMSFISATKSATSDVSTNTYETAHDSTVATSINYFFNKSRPQEQEVFDATIVESASSKDKYDGDNNSKTSDLSVDLIDLEKTVDLLHASARLIDEGVENEFKDKDGSYLSDESVIEILSDNDEIENVKNINNESCNQYQTLRKVKSEMGINHDTYSFSDSHESDKENCNKANDPSEKSMQFNDTMEEVEYMLKKGMEYMAAEAASKENTENNKDGFLNCNNQIKKPQLLSPMKHLKTPGDVSAPASKAKSSIYATPTKQTPIYKGHDSLAKRFDINIKPFPKLDIFAKPTLHARNNELLSKQQKFSHIVSPVGTYMKKTAKTPLMSSMDCKNKDYFNSTAILELENESRLYQTQWATDSNIGKSTGLPKLPGLLSGAKRPLPKKAYISSEVKHIVDERTPVTIPGGKKIQKYLENALMPAVLRHEGKLKMSGGISNKSNFTTSVSSAPSKLPLKVSDTNSTVTSVARVSRRNNASLADLSLMSGDVSMYTIMDAQKF